MAWTTPLYSKSRVDRAGALLAGHYPPAEEAEIAYGILNNWRSSHSFPLNTFQIGLRNRARAVYPSALIAQRLKRAPSIIGKLQRLPGMQLSRMQDIGGCRAVVQSVSQVGRVHRNFLTSGLKHRLVTQKDYIAVPKASGYRGVHLVFRYHSDRNPAFNGLLIEVQLRSRLMHAWATAVEIVDTLLALALKSSHGPDEWLKYFALTSSAFAVTEKTATTPDTPATAPELRSAIRALSTALNVQRKLQSFGAAINIAEQHAHLGSKYYLLELRPSVGSLAVVGYKPAELPFANKEYAARERAIAGDVGAQVVLVAADSIEALRRSYPNYYLDTQVFLDSVAHFLDGNS